MVTFTKKENIPNGKPKAKGKPKANTFANGPAHGTFNPYDLLEGKNGNPTNAQEFEESAHEEGELFFVLDPDFEGTQDELKVRRARWQPSLRRLARTSAVVCALLPGWNFC